MSQPSATAPKLVEPRSRWQTIARRIRVPLGFLDRRALLFELWRRQPRPAAMAWSLAPGAARSLAARLRRRLREKESRTHPDRPLRPHPQSALSGLDADRRRICSGLAQLARGAGARSHVSASFMSRSSPRKSAFCARLSPILTPIAAAFPPDSPFHPGPHHRAAKPK